MGLLRVSDPVEPWKAASPKANTPPSDPTSQYPPSSGVAAMPTTGALRWMFPAEPKKAALPRLKTPPSEPDIHSPWLFEDPTLSCSINVCRVVSLLTLVAAKPAAKHPMFRTQATPPRDPKATTLGLG